MGYKLPKELTEAEWKKHKAALATDTGISDKLRKLATVAAAHDEDDDKTTENLKKALTAFGKDATTAAKALAAPFAKTKTYLEKMAKAANDTMHAVHKDMTERWADASRKEAAAKRQAEFDAREAVNAAAQKDLATFLKVLGNEGRVLGAVVGTGIKFKQAIEKGDAGEAQGVLKEKGIDIPLGTLMKMIQKEKKG